MKNAIILFTLVFTYVFTNAQNTQRYKIDFKSKYGTQASLELLIAYTEASKIPEEKLVLNKISNLTKELLNKYNLTDIYSPKREEVSNVLEKSIIQQFENSTYTVQRVIIADVDFPKEIKILYERLLKLEQDFITVNIEIYDRINKVEKELKTNEKLTSEKKKELEKELYVLKNAKYIQALYDKQMKLLDMSKGY